MSLTMVVPTISKDIPKLLSNIDAYFELLPIKTICIIGNKEVEQCIPKDDMRLSFLDENTIVNFHKIGELINDRAGEVASKRTGWYVQQFIKMGYSRYTDEEYYLLWDSDTVPVKKIQLFSPDNKPYLDCKTEYHKAYFTTLHNIFPDLDKSINKSFVAEHMLINTKYMRVLIDEIESNESIKGESFGEKIINAISINDIAGSGFSEFETYGTYVTNRVKDLYVIRDWKSMRHGGLFFDGSKSISPSARTWLSTSYDAISFEKGDYLSSLSRIINDKYIRSFNANSLEKLSFLIRAERKILRKR